MVYRAKRESIVTPFKGVLACCVALALSACAQDSAQITSAGGQTIAAAQADAYNGPKARIAVSEFEDKMSTSGLYRAEYGRGMSDMLTSALFQTNRFIVLEREKVQAVLAEQNFGASGRVKKETAAAVGEIEGAELMITAAVTGFDPGVASEEGTLGQFESKLGALGSMIPESYSYKKAHIAIDLRVIDTRTARVVAATSVEGSASGFSTARSSGSGVLGGALTSFSKTPMETAIREMIRKAAEFIAAQTPQSYYHNAATGDPAGAVAPTK
jgi:curli biogenesis system outer membrane secretion channel CsgG